ncbi:MAG TPA: hypothetical protein VGE21_12500 [Flavobacteriales bacterium]
MERSAFRKRLRRMHRLLVNSKAALDNASGLVPNKWLQDLFFMLACRRVIMLNLIDKELGAFLLSSKPNVFTENHLAAFIPDVYGHDPANFMEVCELEEGHLLTELKELMYEPGISERARQMVMALLCEAEQNMTDLSFVKGNLLRA